MEHRTPPGTDTLEQIKRVRERYAHMALEVKHYKQRARLVPERIPESVAQSTILIRELIELVTQTNIMPTPPITASILRDYSDLVVHKVEKGIW